MTDTRITLVTGASRGIGRAAAIALAKAGHHVIATGRTQGALEALDDEIAALGGKCTLVPFDLTDTAAIHQLGLIIAQRYERLDGLFANAAILGDITPTSQIDPKVWDKLLATNLTANLHLIRALDPLLRESPSGRALFVTSGVATSRRAYWGAYAASKAGLEALVQAYAREVEVTDLRVNLLDPGATATAMRAKAMPGEDPATLPQPKDLAPLIVKLLSAETTESAQIIRYREQKG